MLLLILDQLLVIHFPAQLEDIVKKTWMHYLKYKNILFNSIITIQTLIIAQQTNKRQTENAKQTNRQHRATDITQSEDVSRSRSSSPDPTPDIKEPVNPSATRKHAAVEDITNTVKRRRAPRAIQPSLCDINCDVAQLELFSTVDDNSATTAYRINVDDNDDKEEEDGSMGVLGRRRPHTRSLAGARDTDASQASGMFLLL